MHCLKHRVLPVVLFTLIPLTAYASDGQEEFNPNIWIIIAAMLIAAKIGGEAAIQIGQPPVLGELCAGILLGNLTLIGIGSFEHVAHMVPISFLAELGVIFLLFEVGLESTVLEMRRIAPTSGLVALLGIIAPMGLGYGASAWMNPKGSFSGHLFVAATLCATSVGITARVLKDLKAMKHPETKVILGAAVIDDILGLLILAIVASIAEVGHIPSGLQLTQIVGVAVLFLVGSLLLGAYVMPSMFRAASKLKTPDVLGAVVIGICLFFAGVAGKAHLAPIVGAFAAGLVLDEVHVRPFGKASVHHLSEIVAPIVAVMAPVFFVRTGMMVQFKTVGLESLALALVLTVVAVIGKLICGIGVRKGGIDRLTVGIGMVPRGEVGLIFANVGANIQNSGTPLISPGIYAAIVMMVMATTIITPPWLAQRIRKITQKNLESTQSSTQAKHFHTPPDTKN